jgi:hypothetical protein
MRFYPHDQDTGGFFVTVLEKKLEAPLEDVKPDPVAEEEDEVEEDVAMDPREAVSVEAPACVVPSLLIPLSTVNVRTDLSVFRGRCQRRPCG